MAVRRPNWQQKTALYARTGHSRGTTLLQAASRPALEPRYRADPAESQGQITARSKRRLPGDLPPTSIRGELAVSGSRFLSDAMEYSSRSSNLLPV